MRKVLLIALALLTYQANATLPTPTWVYDFNETNGVIRLVGPAAYSGQQGFYIVTNNQSFTIYGTNYVSGGASYAVPYRLYDIRNNLITNGTTPETLQLPSNHYRIEVQNTNAVGWRGDRCNLYVLPADYTTGSKLSFEDNNLDPNLATLLKPKFVRIHRQWSNIETADNVWNDTLLSSYLSNAWTHASKIIFTVFELPVWGTNAVFATTNAVVFNEFLTNYVDHVARFAIAQGTPVFAFSVWNEPKSITEVPNRQLGLPCFDDLSSFGQQYTEMARLMRLVTAGLTPRPLIFTSADGIDDATQDENTLHQAVQEGLLSHIDGYAWHNSGTSMPDTVFTSGAVMITNVPGRFRFIRSVLGWTGTNAVLESYFRGDSWLGMTTASGGEGAVGVPTFATGWNGGVKSHIMHRYEGLLVENMHVMNGSCTAPACDELQGIAGAAQGANYSRGITPQASGVAQVEYLLRNATPVSYTNQNEYWRYNFSSGTTNISFVWMKENKTTNLVSVGLSNVTLRDVYGNIMTTGGVLTDEPWTFLTELPNTGGGGAVTNCNPVVVTNTVFRSTNFVIKVDTKTNKVSAIELRNRGLTTREAEKVKSYLDTAGYRR